MNEETKVVRCPSCGREVTLAEARERAQSDEASSYTCPTCGAGFDADGNLVHEPAVGP